MSDNSYLGREVLGSKALRRKEILIEEWGGNILIRELSHAEKAMISEYALAAIDPAKSTIRDGSKLAKASFELIRMSWINGDGSPVLKATDQSALVGESDTLISKIVKEIRIFNNMDEEANARAKKNLEATESDASGIN